MNNFLDFLHTHEFLATWIVGIKEMNNFLDFLHMHKFLVVWIVGIVGLCFTVYKFRNLLCTHKLLVAWIVGIVGLCFTVYKFGDFLGKTVYKFWDFLDKNEFLATWIIGIIGLFFALRTLMLKQGHDFRVMYKITIDSKSETRFSEIHIFNNKDKAEIITKILVVFGVNVMLILKEFEEEALVIPPYKMKTIKLDPISLYVYDKNNEEIVDMHDILMDNAGGKRPKFQFIIATPGGRAKAKLFNQDFFGGAISNKFLKEGFALIQSRSCRVSGNIYSYKAKYFGKITLNDYTEHDFWISDKGILNLDSHKFNKDEMNINYIKNYLKELSYNDGKSSTSISIYQRHKDIDGLIEPYNSNNVLPQKINSLSKFEYLLLMMLNKIMGKKSTKQKRWLGIKKKG